jgi:hypothetical protein
LKGAGNAICAQLVALFIRSFMDTEMDKAT